MRITTAYAIAWIATAFAVAAGVYYTGEAGCMWAMLLPALLTVKGDRVHGA